MHVKKIESKSFMFISAITVGIAALTAVRREIDHAHAVLSDVRQFDVRLLRLRDEKLMRHLNENARAIAGVDLAATRAAMIEIHQDLQALLDEIMRLLALDVGDEADAAGVLFKLRIIQALLRRQVQLWTAGLISVCVSHVHDKIQLLITGPPNLAVHSPGANTHHASACCPTK